MPTNDSSAAPQRRSWKQHHSAVHQTAEMQRTKRFLVVLFGGLALAGFVYLLYLWFWPTAKLRIICLSASDYGVLAAPPIPYATQDIAALERLGGVGVTARGSQNVVSTRFAALVDELGITGGSKDNLLLYLSAHGIHQPEGADGATAQILLSDFDYRGKRGMIPLSQLLASLKESRAATKLLVLDWGHLETDARLGVLVNEFPVLLAEEVKKSNDPNLWVLSSHSLLERSHVSHVDKRSVFGFFLAKGLEGRADGFVDRETDYRINLNELAGYVRHHVSQTVWRDTGHEETQTPQLFHGGQGLVESSDAKEVFLAKARPVEGRDGASPPAVTPEQPAAGPTVAAAPSAAPPASAPNVAATTIPASGPNASASAATGNGTASPSSSPAGTASTSIATASASPSPSSTGPVASASAPVATPAAVAATAPVALPPAVAVAPSGPIDSGLTAALNDSWKDVRRREASLDQDVWTPIDFAPHLWRRYLELLWGYQERVALGANSKIEFNRAELDTATRTLLKHISDAESRFNVSPAKRSLEEHKLQTAVRLRNRIVFRSFDFVRLRNLDGVYRLDSPPLSDVQAGRLSQQLFELKTSLVKLLEMPLTTPSIKTGSGSDFEIWNQNLKDARVRLSEQFRGLETEFAGLSAPAKPRIGALQESSDPVPPGSLEQILWKRARERSRVECATALLAMDPKQSAEFQPQIERLNQTAAKSGAESSAACRTLGRELAGFYRAIPPRIGELRRAGQPVGYWNAEALTRASAVDDVLTDDVLPAGSPNPLMESELFPVHEQLSLDGPGSLPTSAEPAPSVPIELGKWQSLEWMLISNQLLPADVRAIAEFDEKLLEVEGVQGPILSGRSFTCTPEANVRTTSIRLQVRARSTQKDPAALTLKVTAADKTPFEKRLRLALPVPTQIEVLVYDATTVKRVAASVPDAPYDRVAAPDGSLRNALRLRPYPAGAGKTTDYSLRLRDASGRGQTDVRVMLLAVPAPLNGGAQWNFTTKWAADAMVPLPTSAQWPVLSDSTVALPAGGEEVLFPLKPPAVAAAPKEAAPAAPAPAPRDVTSGLVCVVEYGEMNGARRREAVWLDLEPRHPARYVRPKVEANVDPSTTEGVGIAVTIDVQPGTEIPDSGFEVALKTNPAREENVAGKVVFARITKAAPKARLFVPVRADPEAKFDVWLDVDGYPRAFVFEDVSCAAKKTFERTLEPKNALEIVELVGLKKFATGHETPEFFTKPENIAQVYPSRDGKLTFSGAESLRVKLRADAYPLFDEKYDFQIGMKDRPDSVVRFTSDRLKDVTLLPLENGALRFGVQVRDLEAMVDLRAFQNAEAVVHGEITRVGAKSDFYRPADRTIRIDALDPTLKPYNGPILNVLEGDKLRVQVSVSDDSPIAAVEMAFTNKKGEFKEPQQAQPLTLGSGIYECVFDFKDRKDVTVGTNYFALVKATDIVGNTTDLPLEIPVSITARPMAAKAPGGAEVKNGGIIGVVRQGMTPREGVEVKLDKLSRSTRTGPDGRFRFADLPPDSYQVSAGGTIAGTILFAEPQQVTVVSDKDQTVTLQLK